LSERDYFSLMAFSPEHLFTVTCFWIVTLAEFSDVMIPSATLLIYTQALRVTISNAHGLFNPIFFTHFIKNFLKINFRDIWIDYPKKG